MNFLRDRLKLSVRSKPLDSRLNFKNCLISRELPQANDETLLWTSWNILAACRAIFRRADKFRPARQVTPAMGRRNRSGGTRSCGRPVVLYDLQDIVCQMAKKRIRNGETAECAERTSWSTSRVNSLPRQHYIAILGQTSASDSSNCAASCIFRFSDGLKLLSSKFRTWSAQRYLSWY